jgi:hypothetical protein
MRLQAVPDPWGLPKPERRGEVSPRRSAFQCDSTTRQPADRRAAQASRYGTFLSAMCIGVSPTETVLLTVFVAVEMIETLSLPEFAT